MDRIPLLVRHLRTHLDYIEKMYVSYPKRVDAVAKETAIGAAKLAIEIHELAYPTKKK